MRTSPGPGSPTSTSSQRRASGPPYSWMRIAWTMAVLPWFRHSALEVGGEKPGRTLVREIGRLLIVMLAADPGEGVVDAGIAVDGCRRHLGQGVLDFLLRFRRRELVLFSDVQQQRLGDRGGFPDILLDADAVITDRGIDIASRRHEIGELAAQAETDGADLAGAAGEAAQGIGRGDQVLDALGLAEALVEFEG